MNKHFRGTRDGAWVMDEETSCACHWISLTQLTLGKKFSCKNRNNRVNEFSYVSKEWKSSSKIIMKILLETKRVEIWKLCSLKLFERKLQTFAHV